MAAEANQKKSQADEESQKAILNLANQWKKMYFESEEVLARSIDEYVAGQSFTDFLEQMGSQYITAYKTTTQNMDRFFANHPLPTKKDIARVCELVLAVEEKVDHLESDFNGNMAGLASSLIRLVEFQVVLKDELLAIRREVQSMQSQLLQNQENMAGLAAAEVKPAPEVAGPALPVDKRGSRSARAAEPKPVKEAAKKPSPTTPARPRSRSPQTQPKK